MKITVYLLVTFCIKTGKNFRMKWRVYYGTPETVRTVFEPAEQL